MEKKRIYVEKFERDERRHHEEHLHPFEDERRRKHVHVHHLDRHPKMTTKLLTSKEELVAYVNELGEQGHKIDVFKIEDGLYKVVVLERKKRDFNLDEEIEIDIK